jgi:hypothetical protein
MGIVLGMTGSLLGGFYNMFEASEDQSSARMRAQDVFNILSTPIQNAGIGVPSADLEHAFTFTGVDSLPKVEFGMLTWPAPLSIASGDNQPFDDLSGNQLRVVYGVPTGIKHIGAEIPPEPSGPSKPHKTSFSFERQIGDRQIIDAGDVVSLDPYYMKEIDSNATTASLLGFPGADMMPVLIYSKVTPFAGTTRELNIYNNPLSYVPSPDYFGANTIRSNLDVFMIRGAWVYVDSDDTFCFLNIHSPIFRDAGFPTPGGSPATPPPHTDPLFSGFMIEGIAGIWFETDADPDYSWRYLKVDVLTEGDALDEKRDASRAALEAKWNARGVSLKPGVYYEEFSKVIRTRNLQR